MCTSPQKNFTYFIRMDFLRNPLEVSSEDPKFISTVAWGEIWQEPTVFAELPCKISVILSKFFWRTLKFFRCFSWGTRTHTQNQFAPHFISIKLSKETLQTNNRVVFCGRPSLYPSFSPPLHLISTGKSKSQYMQSAGVALKYTVGELHLYLFSIMNWTL